MALCVLQTATISPLWLLLRLAAKYRELAFFVNARSYKKLSGIGVGMSIKRTLDSVFCVSV